MNYHNIFDEDPCTHTLVQGVYASMHGSSLISHELKFDISKKYRLFVAEIFTKY